MKRFHVHVAVADLDKSIRFYSTVFGADPTVVKPDYAKWMIEDPRINFAISARGAEAGVNHLGLQVDSDEEFRAMRDQLAAADSSIVEEAGATAATPKSDKYWVTDPQGIAWETYHSLGSIPMFGADSPIATDRGVLCAGTRGRQRQHSGQDATQLLLSVKPGGVCATTSRSADIVTRLDESARSSEPELRIVAAKRVRCRR